MIDWNYSVKRDLQEYADKCDAVESMRETIAQIELSMTGISSALRGDSSIKGCGEASDRWLNSIVECDEMKISLANTEARVHRIARGLDGLPEAEQVLLDRLYIHHIPFNQTCAAMGLESSRVYELAKKALRHLAVRMYGDAV